MTLYRDILRQSLKSSWQHKYLWFFGLFALLIGGGGELEVITRGFSRDAVGGVFPGLDGLMSANFFSLKLFTGMAELAKTDASRAQSSPSARWLLSWRSACSWSGCRWYRRAPWCTHRPG